MSYTIFTTDSFIIKARQSKDADLSLLIFTKDFGLISATAKSARLAKSKLRHALQTLSFSSVSLVRGREIWRVTSAKKYASLYDKRLPIQYRTLFSRILKFVERFCPKEVVEYHIYEDLKKISAFIFKREADKVPVSEKDIEILELIMMVKVLNKLGYIGLEKINKNILDCNFSEQTIIEFNNKDMIFEMKSNIEQGIIASQL